MNLQSEIEYFTELRLIGTNFADHSRDGDLRLTGRHVQLQSQFGCRNRQSR